MDETRSVESMTNFTLEESMNIDIMQLNNVIKLLPYLLDNSFIFFSFSHPKIMRLLECHWIELVIEVSWWLPRIHDDIRLWSSVPDEHVFIWNLVFQLHDKVASCTCRLPPAVRTASPGRRPFSPKSSPISPAMQWSEWADRTLIQRKQETKSISL